MQFSSNERKALCAIPKLGLHLLFLSFSILTNLSHANTLTQNAALALIDENGHAVIPNGYTSIDGYAFSGATSLASIIIPDSVTSISGGAFYGATSLTSIVIPDSVTSISSYAFYGATSLASVSLGSGITSIGNGAFYGAPSLASIVIPDSVTSIGDNADTYDDGDGILDEEEVRLGTDSLRADSDVDGDGVGNNADVFDSDPLEWFDTDANGVGNNADTDDDGDGYSDLQEVIDGTDSLNALDCKTCPSPVSGLVYHWRTQALLASVDLALVGLDDGAENAFSDDAVTNTSGSYAFTERHGGTNRLTVTKAMTANESGNVISSADALAALKIAVGINPNADPDGAGGPREALPVSPYQYIAADVTGDGRVTSADALDILKMAVKLSSAQARRWLFVSEDYDFWDETANDGDGAFKTTRANVDWEPDGIVFEYPESTTKNIVGILMGDVTGDWSEPAGSARLDEDHLSQWLASSSGSMTQWALGGSSQDTIGLGGGSASTWQKGVYDAPTELAQTCANPRQNATYQDALGTTADENNWIRSWTNDSYLWYEDLPDIEPSSIDNTLDYFNMMRTEKLTSMGLPVDPLYRRWTMDTEVFLSEYAGSASIGYGMHLLFYNPVESRRIFVAFNLPGTPAAGALVDRGTEIIAIDGEPVAGGNVSVILAALAPSVSGESHIFQVRDIVRDIGAFAIRTVTMQSAEIIPTPVPIYRAIDRAETVPLGTTKSVGYVLFNEHSAISEAQLIDGVDALIAAEVDELVLDLRYNSGGLAYVAAQLAYMIAGDAALNQTFIRPTYNDKYQIFDPVNSELIQDMPFLDVTVGAPSLIGRPLNTPLPSLDLFRVFILADWQTCSSSELIINGLRGIGIEVILVGGTTCGKPFGGVPMDNCGTTYYMIQQMTANAVGFGDYADGFRPTQQTDSGGSAVRGCSVYDDLSQPLGQVNEAMLNTALHYIAQGACPSTSMAVRQKHASPWNATLQKTPVSGTAIMGLPRGGEASRSRL